MTDYTNLQLQANVPTLTIEGMKILAYSCIYVIEVAYLLFFPTSVCAKYVVCDFW